MSTQEPPVRRFPTRLYAYGQRRLASDAASEAPLVLAERVVHRFIMGRDQRPRPLSADEMAAQLRDPFASLLLRRGEFPLTLQVLLAALDQFSTTPQGLPEQKVFMVADGGQIPWSPETAALDRRVRLVVARGAVGQLATLFVSTSTEVESTATFLQILAWDPSNQVYHWYDRRGGTWVWAGNSWDALADDSRAHGPFDSHVNGSINMKELKAPWIHWHSEDASIQREAFAPDDPFLSNPLFAARVGARTFEVEIARPGIARWNEARFARLSQGGRLQRLREFFRQILETTTINLVASAEQSSQLRRGRNFVLPITFFVDGDALFTELDIVDDIVAVEVDGGIYLDCLQRFGVALRDDATGFSRPGDAFFACVGPERALEDQVVLQKLLSVGVVSKRLATCLLMVDFSNPVFSARRAALLKYVPATAAIGHVEDLDAAFVTAVQQVAASVPSDTAEQEFLANWATNPVPSIAAATGGGR